MDPTLNAQIQPYQPWFIIAGVAILFLFLRLTRKGLRQRVDRIGVRLSRRERERGLMVWLWLNAPGVIVHELSHALVVLLFYPFGFRIKSIKLFHIEPAPAQRSHTRVARSAINPSFQLGEVQYVRPARRFISHIGSGMSAIAPLFGGIAIFALLYWVATGYSLWEIHLQILRPDWPWWTLLFAPYLILTVTSELWPSSQDRREGRWFVLEVLLVGLVVIALLWFAHILIFNNALLRAVASVAFHIDFVLLALLALDFIFLLIAEALVRTLHA